MEIKLHKRKKWKQGSAAGEHVSVTVKEILFYHSFQPPGCPFNPVVKYDRISGFCRRDFLVLQAHYFLKCQW